MQPTRVYRQPTIDEELAAHQTPDHLLSFLVTLGNNTEAAVGITLTVSGSLVTGTLVGGPVWVAGVAESLRSSQNGAALAEAFEALTENIYNDPEDAFGEAPRYRPTYVHLKGAHHYLDGNQRLPGNPEGVWWRGRLSAVDGWELGELRPA